MGYRTKRGITTSTKYGEDNTSAERPLSANHVADNPDRPLSKLWRLLCQKGQLTEGAACPDCEAQCRFGEEYVRRKGKYGGTELHVAAGLLEDEE